MVDFTDNKEKTDYTSQLEILSSAIPVHVQDAVKQLKANYFQHVDDLFVRYDNIGSSPSALVYIHTIVNSNVLERDLLPYLNQAIEHADRDKALFDRLKQYIPIGHINQTTDMAQVANMLLQGEAALFIEGETNAYLFQTKLIYQRAIEEPSTEPSTSGSKEGFNESLDTNVALLRQRIRTPLFKNKKYTIGNLTQTRVVVAYIENVSNPAIIEEVEKRIRTVELDALQSSHQLLEFIQDQPYSLFPLMAKTERTDRIVHHLLNGGFAIIVDGTPFTVYGPINFLELLHAPDDYNFSAWAGTFFRMLRFTAMLISIFMPSLYVALSSFHPDLLPTFLTYSIIAGRERVPFPSIVEVLLMEGTFEILREAGIRLPKIVGSTISIVGALVIGESAVSAGIISPQMVIIVSITAICSFTIPNYSLGIGLRVIRFIFILLAGFLGFFGIVFGMMFLYLHLTGLKSIGVPYLTPVAPFRRKEMRDSLLRYPAPKLNNYSEYLAEDSSRRRFPDPQPPPRNRE
ncbi:spore germination protein [Paenibacillus gorillae]|uniref:spore germination protein n=1 Tax=Paenibacillus gorillae TaxID=1243662 RepID=UPI0004B5972B|nr:spore germination protein [Paenibacillus gorillae]